MLSWPHAQTDWNYMLTEVQVCFKRIVTAIVENGENVVVLAPECNSVRQQLSELDPCKLRLIEVKTNDTWARDICPITTFDDGLAVTNDFKFNGWGLKFASNFDNLITSELKATTALFKNTKYANHLNFVLEGGSIESDGNGSLLTTSECLLSKNRNGGFSKPEIEDYLRDVFGVAQVLWLDHGFLEGDDTDSHIDTLARFAPGNTILYIGTDRNEDPHFNALLSMKKQLQSFRNQQGKPYNLIELPLPSAIFDDEGNRLPATYANFLIGNGFVLVPTYNQPDYDSQAIETLQKVFVNYKIIGIDCVPLIQQHGSLHCVTMQFPSGSINL